MPCFNEATRLDETALLGLTVEPGRTLLFVNDGSTDDTAHILDGIRTRHPEVVDVLHLAPNRGKAEAVRSGLRHAIAAGAEIIGYYDADLATPPEEMLRLISVLESGPAQFAMASRVALLGRQIERSAARHYLGRIFASAAALALALRVYDTQCGAKAMRVGPALVRALETPFTTRWVFDVELMMRLIRGNEAGRLAPSDFLEMPLRAWEDVQGSKLSGRAMVGAAADLARLAVRNRLKARGWIG